MPILVNAEPGVRQVGKVAIPPQAFIA